MAELTPLDEKLGEVLGLAQAAQKATTHVAGMEDGERFRDQLDRMRDEAEETERRTDALIDSLEGRKTAIRELEVMRLADWAVEIQRKHFDGVRESSLELAEDEARGA